MASFTYQPPVAPKPTTPVAKPTATRPAAESYVAKPSSPTTKSVPTTKAVPTTKPAVSNFTYGLGNPLETRVTQPGQTLPTTTSSTGGSTGGTPFGQAGGSTGGSTGGGGGGSDTSTFPAAGTFAGWEYSADKKKRRMKFHDGQGGFYYGEFESVPAGEEDKSLTERVLAADTFKNTFALIFGQNEANQPYVTKLYELVGGFYKSGSSIDDSLNLALRAAKQQNAIPEFTQRFEGIFQLEKLQQSGMAIEVPSIAEYIKSEQAMGDLMRQAGLDEIANQKFIGTVIGKGKSVLEVGNLISDVFNAIDYAPAALKQDLQTYFPGVDRASIATAILTGPEGAAKLKNKVQAVSVMSAARQQGVAGVTLEDAASIANQGYGYNESLTGFGQVKSLERANTLAQFAGGSFTAQQAQSAVFSKTQQELDEIERLRQLEIARLQGSSGRFASRDRATGLI